MLQKEIAISFLRNSFSTSNTSTGRDSYLHIRHLAEANVDGILIL